MSLIDLNIKIPEYAKEEFDRLIIKYSNETLKGQYKFDKNSMITFLIMTYDKSNPLSINTDIILKDIKDNINEYYKK